MSDPSPANEDGFTFAVWSKEVDRHILSRIGLTAGDLSDWNSWDAWNDGVSPHEGAEMCLDNDDTFSGFDF